MWSHCASFCLGSAGSNNQTVWTNAAKSPWDGTTSKVRVDTSADVQFTISWGDFPCVVAFTWNTFYDKSSCWCINYMSWKRRYRHVNKYAVTFTSTDEKLPLCSRLDVLMPFTSYGWYFCIMPMKLKELLNFLCLIVHKALCACHPLPFHK